jgi:hypothetical protein
MPNVTRTSMANPPLFYADGATAVQLGDCVEAKIFLFIRKRGKVAYVPGISKRRSEFEFNGVMRVCIAFDQGGFGGFWVDPTTRQVVKTVKFLERSATPPTSPPEDSEWI